VSDIIGIGDCRSPIASEKDVKSRHVTGNSYHSFQTNQSNGSRRNQGRWIVTEVGNGGPARKSAKLTHQLYLIMIVRSDADLTHCNVWLVDDSYKSILFLLISDIQQEFFG
jgi:hypothetical protein